jgi:streptogramin lyase
VPLAPRVLLLACFLSVAIADAATAAPVVNGEFPVSETPHQLTMGPDANIWVTLDTKIARITPAGVVTEFDPANVGSPIGITTGPDGNLWVTQNTEVAMIPPANPAGATKFSVGDISSPQGITTGPDGNLWTASADKLIKIPVAAPATYSFFTVLTGARGIARGGDGRLWVADFGGGRIARVTTSGSASYFNVGGGPQGVAAGPGTQVAYTNPSNEVGRITPGGSPLKTTVTGTDPFGVTLGPDGAYWIALFATNRVARLTSSGGLTTLSGLSAGSGPRYITAGPGNTLWVSLETAKKVARISGVTPPAKPPSGGGGGGGGAGTDVTDPRISALRLSPRTFRLGSGFPELLAAVRTGTVIRFKLSEAARVTARFKRRTIGRRVGKRCRRKTRRNARSKKCVRYVRVRGSFSVDGRTGKNRVGFQGRITGKHKLRPGRYRLLLRARDAAGNRSKVSRARFRLLHAKRKRPR